MSKMTTEMRKHIITKSAVSFKAYVLTIDTTTGKSSYEPYTISGSYDTDIAILSAIAGRYTTTEKAVAPMTNAPIEKIDKRFAMFDGEFLKYGTPVKDDTKTIGYMVRTLTLTEITAKYADFDTETFGEKKITVLGEYTDIEKAVAWHKATTPDDKNLYGKFSEPKYYEIKVMMKPDTFFAHAFPMEENDGE